MYGACHLVGWVFDRLIGEVSFVLVIEEWSRTTVTLRPQKIIYACHTKISPGESEGKVKSGEKWLPAPVRSN